MERILMRTRYEQFEIELNDSLTAWKIYESLPLEREINVWGGEFYFAIPVSGELENGKKILDEGEVAFWPEGDALCFFFGKTPVSTTSRPEAFSPVSPVGRVLGDLKGLAELSDKTMVTLERA
ncbi:MAG TPA: cyclophilin-like fold protein [Methanomassiliicoccales archaeon]|nr:cyclophilin-like fold protein [Methanomassiliicoccales archaeon]